MCVLNAATMPRLRRARSVGESVTVCVPARNEARTIARLIADLRAQHYDGDLQVLVLDDDSTDDTYATALAAVDGDPCISVFASNAEPPPGWTGKAAACRTLADLAYTGRPDLDVLVFVDADVRLADDAIAAAVAALRTHDVSLLCPWPVQRTGSVAEKLVQPLLAFSWMSMLAVRSANHSSRSSTVVACGQLMVFDASDYRDIGGHASVASSATEDLDIARVLRRRGKATAVVAGAGFLSCRMYDGWAELGSGYTRWLWSAFGGRIGSGLVLVTMALAYLVPPLAAVAGSGATRRIGCAGYGAAVLSRTVAALSESGDRSVVGAVRHAAAASAHPVSTVTYAFLTVDSHRRRARGRLSWKERALLGAGDISDPGGRQS
ncbi:glycosyltransferase [Rhodococcoides yunnanense]|uniref:glycosyltransferase n=1 Tax=Rhodococcoides yunnanense TaxID=278209 RepID=UPI0009339067